MSDARLNMLTQTALLGTNRPEATHDGKPRVLGTDRVDQLLANLGHNDAAHDLLATAGVLAIHGQLRTQQTEPVIDVDRTVPPESNRPECPADVAEQFEQFRKRGEITLQRKMLEAIKENGWRLPPEAVPDLLRLGTKNNVMRPVVIDVLDSYGHWFAAKNSAWHYALLPVMDWNQLNEIWSDSTQQVRLSVLGWLRKTEPAKGMALLKTRWADETDANRHALLVGLKRGLSHEDEPFIEKELDARQMLVRKKSMELLSMIDVSRFSQRMQKYADLVFEWHLDRKPYLTVKMPIRMSAEMIRDGLQNQTEKRRVDFVTRRLIHIVNCIPLDYWTDKTGRSPEEFIQLVLNTSWPRTLLGALTTAVVRQQRSDWALAILDGAGINTKTGAALKSLDADSIHGVAAKALKHPLPEGKLMYNHPLYILLKEWKHPWPDEVVLEIGKILANYVRREEIRNVPNASLRGWLSKLLANAPDRLIEQFEAMFTFNGEVHSLWASSVEKGLRHNQSKRELTRILAKYNGELDRPIELN